MTPSGFERGGEGKEGGGRRDTCRAKQYNTISRNVWGPVLVTWPVPPGHLHIKHLYD